jgi:hypothetical protein
MILSAEPAHAAQANELLKTLHSLLLSRTVALVVVAGCRQFGSIFVSPQPLS